MAEQKKKSVGIRIIVNIGAAVFAIAIVLMAITYHPTSMQPERIGSTSDSPTLQTNQNLRILLWNINGLMGDTDFDPVTSPATSTTDEIDERLTRIAGVISSVSPDLIALQEVPVGDSRTGRIDTVARLIELLGTNYTCWTYSYYLKSAFLPQKDIMDAVGIAMVILSRYKLTGALRYQLPTADRGFLKNFFYYKRCALQVRLPVEGNDDLIVMNTHLDSAYIAQDTVLKQLKKLASLNRQLDGLQMSWALCGDFRIASGNSVHPNHIEDLRFIETVLKETAMMPADPLVTTNTNGAVTDAEWTRERFGFIFLSTNYSSVSNRLTFLQGDDLSDALPVVADIIVR